MIDATLEVGDARVVGFTDIGARDGHVALHFHGAPSSRFGLAGYDEAFVARGWRVISPDRPGYGTTSPWPGRTLLDAVDDAMRVLDHRGIERVVVVGWSSGGPYAVGCAATRPDRVAGLVVLAGATDPAWPGAWEGFPESEARLMRAATEDDAIRLAAETYGADGSGFGGGSGFTFGAPDQAWLARPEVQAGLAASHGEYFRQGVAGYAQDAWVQGRAWTFDPGRVRCPALVAHGEEDTLVPLSHSRHTAEVVAGARLLVLAGEGHLSIADHLPDLLDDVAGA